MITRMMAAALAAAFAIPAAAQTDQGTLGERARRATERPPSAQPAPAPQPATQGQAQLTDEQRQAYAAIRSHGQVAMNVGDLAATRGGSKEVQELGRRLVQDHRRIAGDFEILMKARGVDVNALSPTPERAQLDAEGGQLVGKTGEEFDREFVSFVTRNGLSFVDALKRARDVTPGKDAQLKKFLDDAENEEESRLSAARELKAQRQARTPPAR